MEDTILDINENSLENIAHYLPFILCKKVHGHYGESSEVREDIPKAACTMKNIKMNFIYDMSLYIRNGLKKYVLLKVKFSLDNY